MATWVTAISANRKETSAAVVFAPSPPAIAGTSRPYKWVRTITCKTAEGKATLRAEPKGSGAGPFEGGDEVLVKRTEQVQLYRYGNSRTWASISSKVPPIRSCRF